MGPIRGNPEDHTSEGHPGATPLATTGTNPSEPAQIYVASAHRTNNDGVPALLLPQLGSDIPRDLHLKIRREVYSTSNISTDYVAGNQQISK